MGLISKIEDKLHSDKGSSNDSSKLQKGSYEDSSSSHLRHPVGSSSAAQGLGSSTGTSGSGSGNYGTPSAPVGSRTEGSSGMPGSYDAANVERDGYGRTSAESAGGYGSYGSSGKVQDVTSGGYGSSKTDPRDMSSSGYGSSTRPQDVTSGGYGREPREPYDPYSSKGQTTAANAAGAYPGGTSREDYGSSKYANDANVPRSRDGGIMNPGSDPSARNPESIPTAGGQRVGSTSANDPYSSSSAQDPYSTSTTQSSGHPIRDAAMYGGAGAAAGGAAGYGASKYGGSETQDPSMTNAYGQHATSNNPQDVSYMNRSAGGMESTPTTAQPGTTTMGSSQPATGIGNTSPTSSGAGSGGMGSGMTNDPKKMGGAYEAGYRDAMEHAKAEMGLK